MTPRCGISACMCRGLFRGAQPPRTRAGYFAHQRNGECLHRSLAADAGGLLAQRQTPSQATEGVTHGDRRTQDPAEPLSNAEIADQLAGLAQLLSTQKENPYKVKAYHRAAARIRTLSESLDELVRDEADLTRFAGIGAAIASAIREIVLTGTLKKLDTLRGQASPEIASLADYPRLDPKRVLRIYKKLKIASLEGLREKLESGEIEAALGLRMAQHVRQGLSQAQAMLLYRADDLRTAVEEFLLEKCRVKAAQVVGACRRRVEVVEEIAFAIDTDDFGSVVKKLERYGGRTPLLESSENLARFALSSGIELRLHRATPGEWGIVLISETGSDAHLRNWKPPREKWQTRGARAPSRPKARSTALSASLTSSRNCAKATTRSTAPGGERCWRS